EPRRPLGPRDHGHRRPRRRTGPPAPLLRRAKLLQAGAGLVSGPTDMRIRFAPAVLVLICLVVTRFTFAADVVFEEGIEYVNPDEQHLKLNLARPKDVAADARLPAVVCIHGGGFRAGKRDGWNDRCKKLAERGYIAVTVDYRLSPTYQVPFAAHATSDPATTNGSLQPPPRP